MRYAKLILIFAVSPIVVLYVGTAVFALITQSRSDFAPTNIADWLQLLHYEAIYVTYFGSMLFVPASVFLLLPIYLIVKKASSQPDRKS